MWGISTDFDRESISASAENNTESLGLIGSSRRCKQLTPPCSVNGIPSDGTLERFFITKAKHVLALNTRLFKAQSNKRSMTAAFLESATKLQYLLTTNKFVVGAEHRLCL